MRSLVLLSILGLAAPAVADGPPAPAPMTWAHAPPPFAPRARTGVKGLRPKRRGLVDLERWPAEPDAPPTADLDPIAFGDALETLCVWLPRKRRAAWAKNVIDAAKAFEVDPFLLGALIFRQSRCRSFEKSAFGVGLTQIHPAMHRPHLFDGAYRYHVWTGETWDRRLLDLPDVKFTRANLRSARGNVFLAAALLKVASEQCPANDGAFGSVPHRHPVSHFVWGDTVRGAGAEDRILTDRRRLLEYYRGERGPPRGKWRALPLHSPLDGAPRKLTSLMGEARDGGRRRHKGLDFESASGEPVRAVAAGTVSFAGVDRKRGASMNVPPEDIPKVKARTMAPGGLLVMIRHEGGLVSAYMHLSNYNVRQGDAVQAGAIIGRVGRSGMKRSAAHLHFELRHDGRHLDPVAHLKPYVFLPGDTWRGKRETWQKKRKKRWRGRKRRR